MPVPIPAPTQPVRYPCDKCGEVFDNPSTRKNHLRNHQTECTIVRPDGRKLTVPRDPTDGLIHCLAPNCPCQPTGHPLTFKNHWNSAHPEINKSISRTTNPFVANNILYSHS